VYEHLHEAYERHLSVRQFVGKFLVSRSKNVKNSFIHSLYKASKKGGNIAKNARKELEDKTGKSVVSDENFLPPTKNSKKLT